MTLAVADSAGGLVLNEAQQAARDTAREFARERLLPIAARIDEEGAVPADVLSELGRIGFFGVFVPERWGGAGLDAVSYALVIEEIARACASTAVIISAHSSLVCAVLLEHGTDAQRERWLTPLAQGTRLGCFALSEPGSGSDAKAMRTTARRDGDGWVLNGTKNFITNGASGHVAVLLAQTDPAAGHKGIACFVVDKGTPGFTVGKLEHKLGIRGSDTAQLHFADCRVGPESLLVAPGSAFRAALHALDGGRVGIAAQAVGIARASLEDALDYARQRTAFDRPISEFQAIQWKLAEMATDIDAARLLTWRAAALKDAKRPYTTQAAMAKLAASAAAVRAATECVQIHGGYGYIREYPAERHYRDAKITELYEGTSEIMHLVIAEGLLKG